MAGVLGSRMDAFGAVGGLAGDVRAVWVGSNLNRRAEVVGNARWTSRAFYRAALGSLTTWRLVTRLALGDLPDQERRAQQDCCDTDSSGPAHQAISRPSTRAAMSRAMSPARAKSSARSDFFSSSSVLRPSSTSLAAAVRASATI